jgi:hypothetical protein
LAAQRQTRQRWSTCCRHAKVHRVPSISATYQRGHTGVWVVFLSTGEQPTVQADGDEVGLAVARATVRRHTAGAEIAVERVDTTTDGIDWHGLLRFERWPPRSASQIRHQRNASSSPRAGSTTGRTCRRI